MKILKFQVFQIREKAWTLKQEKQRGWKNEKIEAWALWKGHTSPLVPVREALKEVDQKGDEWSSRHIAEHFHEVALYRPMVQDIKMLKKSTKWQRNWRWASHQFIYLPQLTSPNNPSQY